MGAYRLTPKARDGLRNIIEYVDARIRFRSVGPTLIAYRGGSHDSIEILIIERGERDWERILEAEDL